MTTRETAGRQYEATHPSSTIKFRVALTPRSSSREKAPRVRRSDGGDRLRGMYGAYDPDYPGAAARVSALVAVSSA
jgi:hypothetical protein